MPDIFVNYWLYFIVIAAIGACLLPARLHVRFYREPNVLTVDSRLQVWFIPLRFNLVNPVSKMIWNLSVNRPWRKKPPSEMRAADVRWFRVFARIKQMQKISRDIWRGANRFFMNIGKPVKVRELNLYIEIALEDAAQTAVAAGAVWAAQGLLQARLAQVFNVLHSRRNLMVVPSYSRTNFLLVDYSCIFQFRLGHIIIIIYQMFQNAGEIYSLIRRISK